MKLVVGLGNVGEPYSNTRHNIGFMAIDAILKNFNLSIENNNFNGDCAVTTINDQKIIFVKPTTLMNLSGNCVSQIVKFYKIEPEDIIIIHDDLDLKPGQFKIRTSGSAGGHNGIKDIISKLGSDKFVRFKIGIGRPKQESIINYVLGKLTKEEIETVKFPIAKSIEFVKLSLNGPINAAISKINQESGIK